MTRLVRSLVVAVAILATLVTAGVVGAARGQAMAAGDIVICAGGGAVTLAVDAEGNPTGPAHWCPDCVLVLLAGLPLADAAPEAAGGLSRASAGPPERPASVAPQARAPPAA